MHVSTREYAQFAQSKITEHRLEVAQHVVEEEHLFHAGHAAQLRQQQTLALHADETNERGTRPSHGRNLALRRRNLRERHERHVQLAQNERSIVDLLWFASSSSSALMQDPLYVSIRESKLIVSPAKTKTTAVFKKGGTWVTQG